MGLFHMSESIESTKKCTCGRDARPGQRDCRDCHRDRQKRYRERTRQELEKLRAAASQGPGDLDTRMAYELKFKTRNVVVISYGRQAFTGTVTGFLPFDRVMVLDTKGSTHTVKLDKLVEDIGPSV
jgi:hypothetical protein